MNKLILSAISLLFGVLSYAQIELPAKLTDRPELIIKHTGYTLSYNTTHNTPNWVAWVLTKSHTNVGSTGSPTKVSRTNQFLPDPCIPLKHRVVSSDYTNSTYDRGHMAPAADMSYSPTSMHDSFYMSNICPQTPTLNRVSRKQLETKCRSWVQTEDTLYIVAGPVYRTPPNNSIGQKHKVQVPDGFFKVILSLRKGHAKAIGFYYSNSNTRQTLVSTVTTVDAIEKMTGIDFFYTLPDNIENAVESKYNLNDWR